MSFKAVSSQVDLPKLEEEVTQFWKENKIFEKSIESRDVKDSYVFVDGPPFVSGLPHYGHLLTSIAKDLIPRYQTMNGKRVRRVWGWDCHGLPVEDKVNKQLGIKSSAQLEEEFGIEKYIQECRNYVNGTTNEWRWYVDKIGRWVDMDHPYRTMDVEFMESVIWGFKQIWDKGLIYKGKRVSLFSTDTSTPVSNFEVAMDVDNYQDTQDLSVFVKFKVKDVEKLMSEIAAPLARNDVSGDVYLVAWTTTPWTIPANFALAVNEKFDYVLVSYNNENLIVARDRLEYTFSEHKEHIGKDADSVVKILAEFQGKVLEGITYEQTYDFLKSENPDSDFKVYLSDDVTIDEGTGVLHIAPAFGEVDFQMGQKYGISAIADIDEAGNMTVGPWKGQYLRDASPLIAEDMQKKGVLLRSELYTHRLPYYRGVNPLIYMAQDAYFIDIQKMKARMSELNQNINWIPKHIKEGRFGQTIETSPDWCISRNRYWATIMPIWQSEDGDQIIVGSIEEMLAYTDQISKKEVDGKTTYYFGEELMDLHRDIADQIIFKKDGKEYRRIPEVLDVWMDSGSAPFAEYHYPFENKELFEQNRPADFIIEYVPQVRAWFNVLHRISTIVFDDVSFTNAICHGTIAGNDGRKMSKSFGNYPDPKELLDKYGADALRLYLMSSPIIVGEDLNFSEDGVAENYRFLLTFWNCYKFFVDYGNVYNWNCELEGANGDKSNLQVMDKWILSKLTELVLNVRKNLDNYNIMNASKALKEFLVEDFSTWYIRLNRGRISNNENDIDRNACLSVMYGVLVGYMKLAAPFIPFITEEMYRNIAFDESVHLSNYPKGDKTLIDKDLMENMVIVRQIVERGHALRKESNMKLRQPLQFVSYSLNKKLSDELEGIIAGELNVKEVLYKESKKTIIEEKGSVELDTVISPALQKEGEARELIRSLQQLRKTEGLTLQDKIEATVVDFPEEHKDMIMKAVQAVSIEKGETIFIKKV